MLKEVINTSDAPSAIGPYSQGIKAGNLVFTSGQLPIDSEGNLVSDDIRKAAKASMENVEAILKEAGTCLDNVIKTVVFVKNMDDFAAVNEVYGGYFKNNPPARSCVEVARLPKDALLEIEAVAVIK